MNSRFQALLLFLTLPFCAEAGLLTHYVSANSASPVSPYTNWGSAAATIQDAVDAAADGDLILVSNGVYQAGARVGRGALRNRVALTRPVTVQSVNGPAVTLIQGTQAAGTTNGAAAMRCAYLTNGAVLAGFTLTNGATLTSASDMWDQVGGGVCCESVEAVVSNCVIQGNSANYGGGGVHFGTLRDCRLGGGSAVFGGGAYESTLTNCVLAGNLGSSGGGAASCTLFNCILSNNVAADGGGEAWSTLYRCTLAANSASGGGGDYGGTLVDCSLSGNSASEGGGTEAGKLFGCALVGNNARAEGGGAYRGALTNCTLTGNSADWMAGGAYDSSLLNCIVFFNTAPAQSNYYYCTLDYCCTAPLPEYGEGNQGTDPVLASAFRLSSSSPCRGSGAAVSNDGLDIDGQPWGSPRSMGCQEFVAGQMTGALTAAIQLTFTNFCRGFPVSFQAMIDGHVSASRWEFGDGTVVSNRPYLSHAWSQPGDYPVVLRAYNDTYPAGCCATVQVHVAAQAIYYVAATNPAPKVPYGSWSIAAHTIQDAVDVAPPGALVLVGDGTYDFGARWLSSNVANRVVLSRPITVQSLNGPGAAAILGSQSYPPTRCAWLARGSALSGFTLSKGCTSWTDPVTQDQSGGAIWCESPSATVSNCVIAGNWAIASGGGV